MQRKTSPPSTYAMRDADFHTQNSHIGQLQLVKREAGGERAKKKQTTAGPGELPQSGGRASAHQDVIVNAFVVGVAHFTRREGVNALDEVARDLDKVASCRSELGEYNVAARDERVDDRHCGTRWK